MNPVPILHRELIILSRCRWFYWLRTGVGAGMALISCIVIAVTWILPPTKPWRAIIQHGHGNLLFRMLPVRIRPTVRLHRRREIIRNDWALVTDRFNKL